MNSFIKYMQRGMYICFFALLVFFGACSEDTNNPASIWRYSENSIVPFQPERNKIIKNPMSGWVLYSGIGDGLSDTFWEDYDNMQSSNGKVKVADYSTTLYIRGAWSDFNPEQGVYIWNEGVNTKPAQRFKMLVEGAKERNLKLAFTFVVDSRDKRYDFTPAYVKNTPGIDGYVTKTGSVQVWSPYPDNPIFQKYYETFIKDFAKKFNNPDLVQYISGQGLGKWGEYHTVLYSTNDDKPREAVFDWVTDLYAKSFDKVPVIINYHRWIGSRQTWDGSNYDPDTERLLVKAINKGFSLRHDAFGMKTYYSTWERNFAVKWKYRRPIILEGGWVKSSHGNSIKGDGYDTYADVRQGEFDEGKGACVNMMDFRYNNSMINSETYSWFNDAFSLVKQFIEEGGYRLYPDRISLPLIVNRGQTIHIVHRWSNLGWGYCPTNIPQWKDKYKVAFALLDKSSLKPQYVYVDSSSEPSQWIKGSPTTYDSTFKIENVISGDYIWAVGIVDTTKDKTIGIRLSVKGDKETPDGWIRIDKVSVH